MKKLLIGTTLALASSVATAEIMDNIYAGGGVAFNTRSGWDNATGFQFFGGYRLDMINLEPFSFAVEAGYYDSGSFDTTFFGVPSEYEANGLWTTAVANYPINESFYALGRVGIDLGDDDGPMIGAGIGYSLMQNFDVRAEYVRRDTIDSLQANVTFSF